MAKTLVQRSLLASEYLREASLDLPPDLSFDEWAEGFRALVAMDSSSKWWLGDAYVYGEEHFGEECSQVLSGLTEYQDETIRAAVWVSRKFPPNKRIPRLTWSHHREVAAMEEKERQVLLKKAADNRMSVRELHFEARTAKDIAMARSVLSEDKMVGRGATSDFWQQVGDDFRSFDDSQLVLYALMVCSRIGQGLHLQVVEAIKEKEVDEEISTLKRRLKIAA